MSGQKPWPPTRKNEDTDGKSHLDCVVTSLLYLLSFKTQSVHVQHQETLLEERRSHCKAKHSIVLIKEFWGLMLETDVQVVHAFRQALALLGD